LKYFGYILKYSEIFQNITANYHVEMMVSPKIVTFGEWCEQRYHGTDQLRSHARSPRSQDQERVSQMGPPIVKFTEHDFEENCDQICKQLPDLIGFGNSPLLFKGLAANCSAATKWDDEYLAAKVPRDAEYFVTGTAGTMG
jgi:hypothetical protein